ncbi:MAG: hypothetical protein ACHP84_20525 [Caulobacterales bacterium]
MRLNWVALDPGTPDSIRVGDLVSADAGGLPVYRVVALANGEARLRDGRRQCDLTAALSRFHWKACAEA